MKDNVKKILVYLGAVLFFLVLAYGFMPQLLGGKIVNQSDITGYQGMAHEMNEWNKAHPQDPTYWTDSAFGGMPTVTFAGPEKGDLTQSVYDLLLLGKRPATYLFISLLGAFLLMLSMGMDLIVAIGGAIAVSFCSYNLQIIQVGHNTKMQAIAFLPWALAALIFTYKAALGRLRSQKGENKSKRSWLPLTVLGSVLFSLAISMQIKANHQQITYYLALMVLIYAFVLFVWLVTDKDRRAGLGRFFVASALLLFVGVAGIATNASKLIPVYKYTAQSMRGGSELQSAANNDGGLELDYATAWSYGWEELPNLMIPNFNGGSSSQAVDSKWSETYSLLKEMGQPNAKSICENLPLYWGPQPFTAGPMYMGAVTMFLFVLGLFFCRGRDKWWLLACTVLAVFLALGSHFIWFTKLFYDTVPMYNKFRTVSMALVVLQVTLPILACAVLDSLLKGGIKKDEFKRKGLVAYAITGGVCLLFTLVPSMAGTFTSISDEGQHELLVSAFQADRMHLLVRDAFRSFALITASFALIFWALWIPKGAKESLRPDSEMAYSRRRTAIIMICFLLLVDLFPVGKRYLNSSHFVTPRAFTGHFDLRPVEKNILQDEALSYRVLDLTSGVFSDSRPSYHFKSVGGYSPAKLQRYQELITNNLTGEINQVISSAQKAETIEDLQEVISQTKLLSALNTKYVILGADVLPAVNDSVYGNAWFVDSYKAVSSPDEALASLGGTDLRRVAVLEPADKACMDAAGITPGSASEGDLIEMIHYAPNELRFHYKVSEPRMVVFSEVYYPEGWHAWLADTQDSCPNVDAAASLKRKMSEAGVQVPVFRADWIFRAAVLPVGEHTLIMRYDPETVLMSRRITTCSSAVLLVLLAAAVAFVVVNGRKKKEEE